MIGEILARGSKTILHPDIPESVRKLLVTYLLPLKEYDGLHLLLHNGLSVSYRKGDSLIADIFRNPYLKGELVYATAVGNVRRVRREKLLMQGARKLFEASRSQSCAGEMVS